MHFKLTKFVISIFRIPLRIRGMSSVVVVDDVSPVVRTVDVDRIRYCSISVVCVSKTQYSVLFVCCVGNVDREAEKSPGVIIARI